MRDGCRIGRSTALKGASSRIAACSERQPSSWLFAITLFPRRKTRPCVSRTVKTGSRSAEPDAEFIDSMVDPPQLQQGWPPPTLHKSVGYYTGHNPVQP